jgi:hypothetical protein
VSTDCYMLMLDVAGGTVVHALAHETVVLAVTGGTEEHTATDSFLCYCWWDYRSYVFGRTNLHGFHGVTVKFLL